MKFVKLVGAVAASAMLVACAGDEDATVEVSAPESSTDGGTDDGGADEEDGGADEEDELGEEKQGDSVTPTDGADDGEGVDADDSDGEDTERRPTAWPDPIALDVAGSTQAGFSIELFDLEVVGSTIEIDARITNGQDVDARLNAPLGSQRTALGDDLENLYALVPPDGDEEFTIPAGEVVEGTLVFVGPLAPDATTVTFGLNPGGGQGHAVRSGVTPSDAPFVAITDIPLTDEPSA